MFRRAIEEGVVDPARFVQVGIRGPLYADADVQLPHTLGVESLSWLACADLGHAELVERIRARVGGRPAFLTFDIDFVDAAYCPGTGTPEVAGPTGFEAMRIIRGLWNLPFVGFDVVEVAPAYDGPGQVTALFAANAVFEFLSMLARRRG
jgi:agmatinase